MAGQVVQVIPFNRLLDMLSNNILSSQIMTHKQKFTDLPYIPTNLKK